MSDDLSENNPIINYQKNYNSKKLIIIITIIIWKCRNKNKIILPNYKEINKEFILNKEGIKLRNFLIKVNYLVKLYIYFEYKKAKEIKVN